MGIKTRQPIWRFFAGRPVERHIFFEICKMLDLDWRETALDPPAELIHAMELEMSVSDATIDELVKKVRSQRQEKITSQCGILHLLDISRPVSIENVYVDVNILEEIASQQWLELSELDNLKPEDVDRYGLGKISDRQISGMQAVGKYSKLSVLGKPGSGKTTFLQYLAIQSNQGNYSIDKVPIFITLRDFAHWCQDGQKFDLLEYIHQEFLASEISDLSVLQKMLQKGRILFLLDGMDEVRIEDESNIYNEIRQFFERYYKNQVVVTCRTAAQKFSLQGFTDVEIAPFTQEQISAFARKWFITFSKTDAADGVGNFLSVYAKTCPTRKLAISSIDYHTAISASGLLDISSAREISTKAS